MMSRLTVGTSDGIAWQTTRGSRTKGFQKGKGLGVRAVMYNFGSFGSVVRALCEDGDCKNVEANAGVQNEM